MLSGALNGPCDDLAEMLSSKEDLEGQQFLTAFPKDSMNKLGVAIAAADGKFEAHKSFHNRFYAPAPLHDAMTSRCLSVVSLLCDARSGCRRGKRRADNRVGSIPHPSTVEP